MSALLRWLGGKGGGWRAIVFAADQKLCQIVARGKPP
jgi:hypothetical protein